MKYNYETPKCEHCEKELELKCLKDSVDVEYNFRKSGKNNWVKISKGCTHLTCWTCHLDNDAHVLVDVLKLASRPLQNIDFHKGKQK